MCRYSRKQFESAATHDPLWNAAQRQLVAEAKMHGFLRMYWNRFWSRLYKTTIMVSAFVLYLAILVPFESFWKDEEIGIIFI